MIYRNPLTCAVLLAAFVAIVPAQPARAQSGASNQETWHFASMPDFLNADVADITSAIDRKPGGKGRHHVTPNATHPLFEQTIHYILDDVASGDPEFVLAAGDIVNGEWNRYSQGKGRDVFGPTGTLKEARQTMNRSATVYYARWIERFNKRGLTAYPAPGDHEYGDNSWPPKSAKSRLVPHFRALFAKYFTRNEDGNYRFDVRPKNTPHEGTAYAFKHRNMVVVSVDLHDQPDPDKKAGEFGSIVKRLGEGQKRWLKKTLRNARNDDAVDFIIVQGHYPVLPNIRYSKASSKMTVKGGAKSDFWKIMDQYNVDLYFAGEVHDVTTSKSGSVHQVVHGGWLSATPKYTYLRGTVKGDRMMLELNRVNIHHYKKGGKELRIWQHEWPVRVPGVEREKGFQNVGRMVIDRSSGEPRVTKRTGRFTLFDGSKKMTSESSDFRSPDSK